MDLNGSELAEGDQGFGVNLKGFGVNLKGSEGANQSFSDKDHSAAPHKTSCS